VGDTTVTTSMVDDRGEYQEVTYNITVPGKFVFKDSEITLIDAIPEEFIVFHICWKYRAARGSMEALVKPSANITALNEVMEQHLAKLQEDDSTKDTYMWKPEMPDCTPSTTTTSAPFYVET